MLQRGRDALTGSTKSFLGSASQEGASNGVESCSCWLIPAAFGEARPCGSQRHRITAKKLQISLLISPLNGNRARGGEYWQLGSKCPSPLILGWGGCQHIICILICLMPVRKQCLPPAVKALVDEWGEQSALPVGSPCICQESPLLFVLFLHRYLVPCPGGARSSLCRASWDSVLGGLNFKRNRGSPLFVQSSPETAWQGYSFRVLRKVLQILVTPAITENVLQFRSVGHGQEIIFKDSCGIQGILFPFPFIFCTKKLRWKALPFWIPCHRNLTALLRTERITCKMTEIVSKAFFTAPETLTLQ